MKRVVIIIGLLSGCHLLNAQNQEDVLRYSMLDYSGTARFNAMGGAFVSLGTDVSSISLNPGGLGAFDKSDFSITPSFIYNQTTSSYNGAILTNGDLNFNINNYSMVFKYTPSSKWEAAQWAIGYNRLNNFTSYSSIRAYSQGSSLLDNFVSRLNEEGITQDNILNNHPFDIGPAYEAWLINPVDTGATSYYHILDSALSVEQSNTKSTVGGMGETYIAYGGNYDDKLYLGASVGFPRIRYVENNTYTEETLDQDTGVRLSEFSVSDYLRTLGNGVNLKLGLIYKPKSWLRLGLSVHSPTYFFMTDRYNGTTTAYFKDGSVKSYDSPSGRYDYALTTPWRFLGGASLVFYNKGLISADYEFVDYSLGRLSTSAAGDNFFDQNTAVRSVYTAGSIIRLGGEYRLDPFRLRAGYQYRSNPINTTDYTGDLSQKTYSIGAGVKNKYTYIDVAYALSQSNTSLYLYDGVEESIHNEIWNSHITFTFGMQF